MARHPFVTLFVVTPFATRRSAFAPAPSFSSRRRDQQRRDRAANATTAEGERLNYFALLYVVVEGFVERRAPYRAAHLRLAQEARDRGELLLAGALGMPADRALLVFRANDSSSAEAFARADPYVVNGLVTRWEVQPWAVVIGNEPGAMGRVAAAE